MLLTISTNHKPATDLGYLLHKHPDRCQSFDLSFGKAHVFYPEASADRCVACLLLDVDPVGLVRGKGNWKGGPLDQYVNDRPYVASSLMSVAISQVFGSALAGRSKERVELVETPIPLTVRIDVLPVRGGKELLQRMFEPLGYTVTATQHSLDEQFPDWGEGHYFSVELEQTTTVAELLQHLYVLIPVFDGRKHYYIGPDEVEKLLAKGESWLHAHRRLKLDRLPERQRERIQLIHGSLTYRDKRLANFDAAAVVEVIDHLDPPRLKAFERVVFEQAQPRTVVLTTPNQEYNVMWESLPAGEVRHSDHRFEWTRAEFQEWANGIAERFGYSVRFLPVGPEDAEVGAPSQMGVFERMNSSNA